MSGLDKAALAGLIADRSRVAVLDVLLDGRGHPVGTLEIAVGVASSKR